MRFKNIDEALYWVMNQRRGATKFEEFKALIDKLNHPEGKFKMIHVAGTNGKGSTVTFIRDSLMALGYNVGTLQSPHYRSHLDRIRVNGKNISEEAFLRILNQNYEFYIENNLNMFEIDYLIMCEYFKEMKVDFAVVEVGMGGRLDSTNVVLNPLLSIIVTIGYDHMETLGYTLESITKEKCGIIKNNSAVLVGHLKNNLKDIVKKIALDKNSLYLETKEYQDLGNRSFSYRDNKYELSSFAKYQLHNASVAIEALYYLNEKGYINFDYLKIKEAIKNSLWNGRFEIIKEKPLTIIDGAHNIDGVKALIETIKDINKPKAVLFSAIKTKEYDKMLELIKENVDEVILTKFEHIKLMDIDSAANKFNLKVIDNFKEAYEYLSNKYDCVIVCGSLYFISDFIEGFDYE